MNRPCPNIFGTGAYNLHFWNPGTKGFHLIYCLLRLNDWKKFKYDFSTKISIFFQFLGQDTVFRVAVQGFKITLETSNFLCSFNNPHRVNKTIHGDEIRYIVFRALAGRFFWCFHKNANFRALTLTSSKCSRMLNFCPRKKVITFLQIGHDVLSDDTSFVRIG